ncbi:TonB-dependent hemoglobin/transferrin/lactoferrin family receptor [Hwanghaeella grinnelliae]|uniref:TonB-dependent hemoglobin/transferrin/lactoferrin family receptor n=1 Tax=Hwanghaeella grinnelliae TaxID=2500179 RepID=UPI00138733C3|nr:TonB-dependent hemoglobin/transferrin/lactoferrin family receptor [Hwanghaeella grinnelliae]
MAAATFLGASNLAVAGATAQGVEIVQATTLDSITVTGTRTEKAAIEVPAAITVVDRESIEASQAKSLDDILETVPGLEMGGGPRDSAEQPNIRGFSGERVVMRVDGVRKNFEAGHRGRVFMEPSLLKQVDVLRGPSSTLYGSGAIGGVVSIETVDAADLLKPGQTIGAMVRTGFHTSNSQRFVTTTGYGAPTENTDVLVSVTRSSAGNYTDGSGDDVPGSGDSILSGLAKGSVVVGGHGLEATLNSFKDDHIIPTAANTDSEAFADRVTNEKSAALTYTYEGTGNWLDARATTYYSRTDIREIRLSDGRHQTTELDTVGVDAANTSRFTLSDWANLNFTAGLEAFQDRQVGTTDGTVRQEFPTAERNTQGYFFQAEFVLYDDLTITPAARYDYYNLTTIGQPENEEGEFSKQIAVSYRVTPWLTAFGSYAEAFRAPSLTELFVGGTHFAFNNFVANPDLRPEFARNKEIGLATSFDDVLSEGDALRMKGSIFRNDVDDLIELQVVGGAFGTSTNVNVTEARIEGIELEAGYESDTFFGAGSYARLRGDDLAQGDPISDIPEDKATATIGYKWPQLGVRAGWRTIYYAGQERVPAATEAVSGEKFIHDVFVSWIPKDKDLEGLRVDFAVDNIMDKDYQRFLSELREAGRNAKLSISYKF